MAKVRCLYKRKKNIITNNTKYQAVLYIKNMKKVDRSSYIYTKRHILHIEYRVL